ncbi:MAG: MOSC domain-containing protein [Gemmatimonadaceae bacterium]
MSESGETTSNRRDTRRPVVHTGVVVSVNVPAGGVPKRPVDRVRVSVHGMGGDQQRNLAHHGGKRRALCLYSADLIDALRAEGHSIGTGDAGENLTVRGVPLDAMAGGARLRIGDVVAEVTGFADACHNLRPYFTDQAFARISQKVHPGWSRVHARVVRAGVVARGDTFSVVDA